MILHEIYLGFITIVLHPKILFFFFQSNFKFKTRTKHINQHTISSHVLKYGSFVNSLSCKVLEDIILYCRRKESPQIISFLFAQKKLCAQAHAHMIFRFSFCIK